jgi:hypothetical protein
MNDFKEYLSLINGFTTGQKLRLLWGKLRRFIISHAFPGYMKRSHARRLGECGRCGVCCKLLFKCNRLSFDNGEPRCDIHHRRSNNCRNFPIDERDLRDRDIINPRVPCGYSFILKAEFKSMKAAAGNKAADTPLPAVHESAFYTDDAEEPAAPKDEKPELMQVGGKNS